MNDLKCLFIILILKCKIKKEFSEKSSKFVLNLWGDVVCQK